jgi:thiamine transport system permease protein
MVTDIQRMRYWSPTAPKISWSLALMAAIVGWAPFIAGLIILTRGSGNAPSDLETLAPGLARAALYTLKQASLSALIVAFFAPFLAIGLFYFPPRARHAAVATRTLSFCLPSIVMATGIVLAWGNNGRATRFFESVGISPPFSMIIYSPYAIVFANTLMNLPFASLMVFRAFSEIPSAQLESSELLGLSFVNRWRYVAWPAIKPAAIYFTGITFLLSLGSFGTLSILGGGPAAQTLELAIFQSIYFDGNWQGAAVFAGAHTMLAGAASALFVIPQYRWLSSSLSDQVKMPASERALSRFIGIPKCGRLFFILVSVVLDLLIAIPVIAILADAGSWALAPGAMAGISALTLLGSVQTSLTIAIPAAIMP